MKTIQAKVSSESKPDRRIPALLLTAAALALAFCFSATAGVPPPPPQCTVCHKRTQTQMYDCSGLEYQRHLDHGDPPTACGGTPTEVDRESKKG